MIDRERVERLTAGRPAPPATIDRGGERDAEGGCGVIGVAVGEPVAGRHLIRPLAQMHNRGNGKGGGLCAAGCFPAYESFYALHVGYLDAGARAAVEERFITPHFDVERAEEQPELDDHRALPHLEVRPPRVWRYFVRVRPAVLDRFARQLGIDVEAWDAGGTHGECDPSAAARQRLEDEFVYRNSFELNAACYAASSDKTAFVLSHGKDLLVLKGVGYAEEVAAFYRIDELRAHIWIGHQRYPTRGRVWHPGGAHPFAGLHEALVHNGDLANYHSICTYLRQRRVRPLFLTDTEVAALLFDHYQRVLDYPLEWTIEALAPTGERDFELLPKVRQRVYRALRAAHIHGSPDGPWFFILARNALRERELQLVGITDTSMLRPQVFALCQGTLGIGAVASERQAVDAFLSSLAAEDPRVCPVPDRTWSARGGSHTDGGAFVFRLRDAVAERPADDGSQASRGRKLLTCTDKFGHPVHLPGSGAPADHAIAWHLPGSHGRMAGAATPRDPDTGHALAHQHHRHVIDPGRTIDALLAPGGAERLFDGLRRLLVEVDHGGFGQLLAQVVKRASRDDAGRGLALRGLTLLRDRRVATGQHRRSRVLAQVDDTLRAVLDGTPRIDGGTDDATGDRRGVAAGDAGDGTARSRYRRIVAPTAGPLPSPTHLDDTLVIDATRFPPEGPGAVARLIAVARAQGYRRFVAYNLKGDRFIGCGLGADSRDVRIDCYGSTGDYAGSGLDGAELHIHGDGQDQLGQVMKSGRLVVHGDVGQAFLYGAKGGEAYVLGNTGGRPLINAVGTVRAIVNGTCLDYAGESFMAGADLGAGFLLVGGLRINVHGEVMGLEERYPGNSFFALASGGAGYVNDPYRSLTAEQLNGTVFTEFTQEDWAFLEPFLRDNESLFGISIERDILTVDGIRKWPGEVFRKVTARPVTRRAGQAAYAIGMVESM